MTRRPTSLIALLLLVAACAPDPAATDEGPRPDVLLVCLDTVRPDHLGCMGYDQRPTTPTLDGLAAAGLLFKDVTAASGWTKPSVPSFLTGTWPAVHGVYEGSARRAGGLASDVLPATMETLAERFEDAGYDTAAFLRNAQLRPGLGFEQGFDVYRDQAGDAGDIRAAASAWLSERSDDAPFFLYLHVLDAHWPYDVPDEAAARWAGEETLTWLRDDDWRATRDAINDGDVALDAERREQILALYDGALAYADDQLGRLLDELRARPGGRDLVVAVVTDHGEEFGEHGRLGHGHGLWENLTRAVFLIQGPGIPTGEVTTPVGLPDLHPTLLAAAGLEPSPLAALFAVDRLANPERAEPVFAEHKGETQYEQSLRVGDKKLVRRFRLADDAAALSDDLAHLVAGGRWEAELAPGDGPRRALQLKPRDEPEDDEVELKGFVIAGPSLLGVDLVLPESLALAGTLANAGELLAGGPVKLEGELVDDRFLVGQAKGYAPDEAIDLEIRGPVTRVLVDDDGVGGTVWLGGIPVLFDADTRFKGVPGGRPDPLLDRRDVATILELGGDGAAAAGYEVVTRLFALGDDPDEQRPLLELTGTVAAASDDVRRLARLADARGRALVAARAWNASEDSLLDEDEISDLRALGYVR